MSLPSSATRRRALAGTILALLALPLLAVTGSPSGAQTAGRAAPRTAEAVESVPTVDAAHPFSDPVFLPVRDPVYMDCYSSNQLSLCGGRARDWQLNLLATELDATLGVYAMGAGRLKVVEGNGPACGQGKGFGTYLQIDHGGGVTSGYTHLSNADKRFLRLDGQLVAAGQRIGTMGTTGAQNAAGSETLCRRNYLDFFVQRGPGVNRYEIKSLTACVAGRAQSWPAEMYPQHPTWNQLPKHIRPGVNTVLPTEGRSNEVPDDSCIPTGAPATFNQSRPASLAVAGSNRLLARWTAPTAGHQRTMLEVQVKRPAGWNTEGYASVPAGQSSVILREANGIANGRTVRVLVSHHNGVGWGRWSNASNERVVGTPPAAPRIRALKVFRAGRGAAAVLGWSQGNVTGYAPTGWMAEVRRGAGRWRAVALPRRTYSYRWTLARGTTYTVRVKARSLAGFSPYLTRRVTTPR